MVIRRIGVVTGTRAEYGLLSPLLSLLKEDPKVELLLYVTGMHLSPEFGSTYRKIEEDGFYISEKVEILLSSDTPIGVAKSISLGISGFADAFQRKKPDILVLLGDRFEMLAAAIAATVERIPIAHIHGGELTQGLIDDPIRHSITKMASLHFVSTEQYRKRVIQMGESPKSVKLVGALGIDAILNSAYASYEELNITIPILKKYSSIFLVTVHPETLNEGESDRILDVLLPQLDLYRDTAIIITGSNADSEGRKINKRLKEFCRTRINFFFSISLGSYLYLGLLRKVDIVIGNSSSGLLEAPALGIPSVDIGYRQWGRVAPSTVFHCNAECTSIAEAIEKALKFRNSNTVILESNPYWQGGACLKIMQFLRDSPVPSVQKEFFDLNDIQGISL